MEPPSLPRITVERSDELWDWLERHHDDGSSVLLVTFKKRCGDRYVGREDVLDALVAYGWVDGRRFKLDEDRTMQLIGPRRQQRWAASYRERFDRLEAEGRMRPAGAAALERAERAGMADEHAHVDRLQTPDDLMDALNAHDATRWWDAAAPSYRRNVLRWVASAKKPETRAARIETIAAHSARSEKVPNY